MSHPIDSISTLFASITLIYLLYLFYGAAFLYLGVSIAAKDMKESDLKLPTASKHEKDPPRKANYISVQANGTLILNRAEIQYSDLLQELINLRMTDQDLNIIIRGDAKAHYKLVRQVLDICQQANIAKVQLQTDTAK